MRTIVNLVVGEKYLIDRGVTIHGTEFLKFNAERKNELIDHHLGSKSFHFKFLVGYIILENALTCIESFLMVNESRSYR